MIIGITPRFTETNGVTAISVNQQYLNSLIKVGLTPIILPNDVQACRMLLPLCQGFLIIGGGDINSIYYASDNNGQNEGTINGVNDLLDQIDALVVGYAAKNKQPVMGICRGIQAINTFMGGSLWKDLASNGFKHEFANHCHMVTRLETQNHSRLAQVLPKQFLVNTIHHQAVKELAPFFHVIMTCDGVIEAIEHDELPMFGVQWHPERLDTPESAILFNYFAQLVAEVNHETR